MSGPRSQMTVIDLESADAKALGEFRSALAVAFLAPAPCVLVDLRLLPELDGPVLAALLIGAKEVPVGGRFALLTSESVFSTIENWSLDAYWQCFTDPACAEAFLLDGREMMQ